MVAWCCWRNHTTTRDRLHSGRLYRSRSLDREPTGEYLDLVLEEPTARSFHWTCWRWTVKGLTGSICSRNSSHSRRGSMGILPAAAALAILTVWLRLSKLTLFWSCSLSALLMPSTTTELKPSPMAAPSR